MLKFDYIAEEAVRLKEKKIAKEVIAVTIGPKTSEEVLRTALAMGCDKAIRIDTNMRTDQELQPLIVAKVLKQIAEKEKADMVIVGKQSIDSDNGQVGQMLAGLLDWPQSTFTSKIEIAADHKSAQITRETDKGMEQLNISLPAVVTTDLRLNEPRYTTLPNIMKAKKVKIDPISLDSLNLGDLKPQNEVISVEEPPARKAGGLVDSVDALINKLKNEAKVI
jgi:electron transfer flavoprotein beta subunit